MSEKQTEHHWHDPSQGQVTKAMLQHFSDLGLNKDELLKMARQRVDDIVEKVVTRLLGTEYFTQVLIAAVAHSMSSDKKPYEQNKYGYHNRLRDMVNEKIKEVLLADYEVTVTRRATVLPVKALTTRRCQ